MASLGLLLATLALAPAQVPASSDVAEESCRHVLEQASTAFLWCGCDAARLTPRTVAEAFAPILWFSSDEPFLPRGFGHGDDTINIPTAFPLDRRADGAVVYYMLSETYGNGRAADPIPGCDAPAALDMRTLDRLELIYFFYYPADRGVGGHRHDFEKLGLDVRLRRVEVGGKACYKASLFQATAYAHALNWMSNRLRLPQAPERSWEDAMAKDAAARAAELSLEMSRERVLPLTLLVEEGKHGVCTDRNADGVYNPGYDVNRYVNEAWGLRDNLGSSRVGARFVADMAKIRDPRYRLFPALNADDPARASRLRQIYECSARKEWDPRHVYELRLADSGLCRAAPGDPAPHKIPETCREHHFGGPTRRNPLLPERSFLHELVSFGVVVDDRVRASVAAGFWNMPFTHDWLGLRLTYPWRADLFYLPSASRTLDWYLVLATTRPPWLITEAGLKLRMTTRNARVFGGPLRWPAFMGLRVGLQTGPPGPNLVREGPSEASRGVFDRRSVRLVIEVGGGTW